MTQQIIRQNFKTIHEFLDFLEAHKENSVFKCRKSDLSSQGGGSYRYSFTKTNSFEEAVGLIKNGWDDMARKLEERLQVKLNEMNIAKTTRRNFYDVAGFQASVPRTLQGLPTNMVNQKTVAQKQRVITIAKDILYRGGDSTESIIESSIKALQIVKAIEAKGVRVNLTVFQFNGGREWKQVLFTQLKVKDSSERINVAKMAFALVHPSMFRRLFFRYIEVEPQLTDNSFGYSYGYCENDIHYIKSQNSELKDTYILPLFIKDIDSVLKEWGFI